MSFERRQQFLRHRACGGWILAGHEPAVDNHLGLPIRCRGVLGALRPKRILELVRDVFASVIVFFLLREGGEFLATHEWHSVAEIHSE